MRRVGLRCTPKAQEKNRSEAEATIEALLLGQSEWHMIRDGVRRLSV
jgi:hypothetical protein